jgi:hypothetical protein
MAVNSGSHERFEEEPRCVLPGHRKDRKSGQFDQTGSSRAKVPIALLEHDVGPIANVRLKIMLAFKGLN